MKNFPIKIKRIYEAPTPQDGIRVLVDRLWPRGVAKKEASIDYWFKEAAPSNELRKWFNHKEENFKEFVRLYKDELKSQKDTLEKIKELAYKKPVTLVYAAKNTEMNQAVVLQQILEKTADSDKTI